MDDAASTVGGIIVAIVLVIGGIFGIGAIVDEAKKADAAQNAYKTETQAAAEVQGDLVAAVPIPQLETSSERANVSKRAQLFNNEDKISYIYLVNYGRVMAFYTVKGKVSSLRSYMAPTDKLVDYKGRDCSSRVSGTTCYQVEAPDIDGTYGENVDGIFFFTTEDAYVEWRGEYMMSDQPLKLSSQPELIREIK